MTSLGVGYAPGMDDDHSKVGALTNLGFGYTSQPCSACSAG